MISVIYLFSSPKSIINEGVGAIQKDKMSNVV